MNPTAYLKILRTIMIPLIVALAVLAAFGTIEVLLRNGTVYMPRIIRQGGRIVREPLIRPYVPPAPVIPTLPAEPVGADDQLKGFYANAVKAHDARLAKPEYIEYLTEGLEWKTVGDFASAEARNAYYEYAAYIYKEAGEKFPTEWVPWLNVGNMFVTLGQYGRAEQAFKKSAAIAPNQALPYVTLLEALTNLNVRPSPDLKAYFRAGIANITVDQFQVIMLYAKYLLTNAEYRDALDFMKWATETLPGDERLQAEYRDLKKYFEKNPIE